ncbi:MAG: hypothetical protein QM765_42815 [Myxococcales bacterium]
MKPTGRCILPGIPRGQKPQRKGQRLVSSTWSRKGTGGALLSSCESKVSSHWLRSEKSIRRWLSSPTASATARSPCAFARVASAASAK